MRDGVNLRCLSYRLVRGEPSLGVNQVRRENSVDERRLSQTRLSCSLLSRYTAGGDSVRDWTPTDDDHVELEATLQELVLDLRGDAVETDVRRRANFLGGGRACAAGHRCVG